MGEYSFRKMNRKELLVLLKQQLSDNEELKAHAAALEKQLAAVQEDCARQLADRKIAIAKAGTMAEAAMHLNRIFADADLAAREYLENVKRSSDNAEALIKAAKEEAARETERILAAARIDAEKIRSGADVSAQAVLDKARRDAGVITADAQSRADRIRLETDRYQKDVKEKMSEMYNSYKGLRSIFGAWGDKSEK